MFGEVDCKANWLQRCKSTSHEARGMSSKLNPALIHMCMEEITTTQGTVFKPVLTLHK